MTDIRRMTEDDKTLSPNNYFKAWIDQIRQNLNLKARIVALQDELSDANHQLSKNQLQLAESVPLKKAKTVVKHAYTSGQLLGKRELEANLAFPWLPERTVHFSQLQVAYTKSLSVRATGGTKKSPTPKTLQEYGHTIGFFIAVMGDLKIGEINREIAGEYFSILRELPANLSRVQKYQGKSISELRAMGDPPQSEVNASKKMERISVMFKWALEEKRAWGIDANPFTGFGQAGGAETTRRPFSNDELRTLLNHPAFIKRKFPNSYSFWLIPLAIFTGARLGELCQLDIKDFVEHEGIPCIDINDTDAAEVETGKDGRKKRVKNKNAKRLVPIHSALIEIGLLRYVDKLRQQGQQHLFPELSRTRRDGPAHAASNWFQRFRDKVGITTKQETVFHSFRHLFITNILDSEVSPNMLAPIVGHEAELITGKVYWNKKDATKRKPTVEVFKLPVDVKNLIPRIEDIAFSAPRSTPPQ
jgi:integrase